ncbi:hypothetical protein, variant 8 [Aphanomyces astaci]|nr:hypothetical protein, variant 8 [Aphanomyces astaci]ETV86710.1 hypothetical protein, variant 8 [Aphanomyces astaci]|eukprot:XP_009823504.1 hypothetical protein, variant 8 [Aphanomyces astaci]
MHLRSRNAVLRQTQHVAMPAVHRKRGASGTSKSIKMEVKTEAMESLNPKAEENSGFKEEQLGVVVVPAMKLEVVETGSFVKDEEPTVGIKTDDEANSRKMVKKSKHAHAPVNWKAMWDGIAGMRAEKSAAVDAQGCETFNDMTLDPPVRRFHVLVACMLSSQTKDPVTAAAMGRLRAHGTYCRAFLLHENATHTNLRADGRVDAGHQASRPRRDASTCGLLQQQSQVHPADMRDSPIVVSVGHSVDIRRPCSVAWRRPQDGDVDHVLCLEQVRFLSCACTQCPS